jgi:hypothetical protein
MKKKEAVESVTIWTRSGGPAGGAGNKEPWDREVFEDLELEDLVRTRLDRYSGSGPGKADMALLKTVTSRWDGTNMTDTTHVAHSPGHPDEVERGVNPIFLGQQLAALACMSKELYISDRWAG